METFHFDISMKLLRLFFVLIFLYYRVKITHTLENESIAVFDVIPADRWPDQMLVGSSALGPCACIEKKERHAKWQQLNSVIN